MRKFTQWEKGFLEGVIDSEGCLGLYIEKTRYGGITYKPEFSVANNDLVFLKKVKDIINLGGGIYPQGKGNKCHAFRLKAGAMRELLPKLNLIVKEKQRKVMIKVLDILEKRRHGFGTHNPEYKLKELEKYYLKMRKR